MFGYIARLSQWEGEGGILLVQMISTCLPPFYKGKGSHCKDAIPKNSKQISPENELCGLSPNFHIHASEREFYIPKISLRAHRHMNVEIGTEAAQEPEYINEIFVAVQHPVT